jgi:two-component system phosphate regulon sensor histidine kinase PhoR
MNDPQMEKEVMARFLETIFTSSRRLNDLINDVLELHRLESIDQDFSIPEPTEISEVNQAVSGLFEKVDGKTISLIEEVGRVSVHFEHITSVLTNLIDNAVKYSTGGNIDASIKGVKGGIKIEVADEGPQVPEEERMRIFERFYTVSKSRAKGKSGTGLGLSIVKHISQIYNGSVTLTRNSNGGNTFTVILHERPRA